MKSIETHRDLVTSKIHTSYQLFTKGKLRLAQPLTINKNIKFVPIWSLKDPVG